MHGSVLGWFAGGALTRAEVSGRDVIEVGSGIVNGTVRPLVESFGPRSYVGADLDPGPGVDVVCDVERLVPELGADYADVVISTEMLEHVRDWRAAIAAMVLLLRPGGVLVISTRSIPFPYHEHPHDFWRYSLEAFEEILSAAGLETLHLVTDPEHPGVFAKARKPHDSWDQAGFLRAFHDLTPAGVTPMAPPLTYLGLPFGPDGGGYYRMYLPFRHLAANTTHRVAVPPPSTRQLTPTPADLAEVDVLTVQRGITPAVWRTWKEQAASTRLVYEVDDDLLRVDTAGLPHLHDDQVRERIRACIGLADAVTVSTPALAEQVRPLNERVYVLGNHINAELLAVQRPRRDRLTIGWAGGDSHQRDVAAMGDALADVLADSDADMHWVGHDFGPTARTGGRFTPWRANVWDYYRTIDFDIGVIPLSDHPFNESKSHIKALEFGALGIPVVASDSAPYRDFVQDGVTGYLVRTPEEWRARLRDLIYDEAARDEMGAAARKLAAGWTIQAGWRLWNDAYEEIAGA